ncbi:MAG: zinc-binding dehydrogenase [Hahellaceae bacterium]|nr:zinc-binding dehydrogenase [Hahellaceae bacterium]
MVMGYEVSGIIDQVGSGIDSAWLGKEVIALTRFGGQADQVVVPLIQVIEKPATLSFVDAAAIPVNYLTAWMLLIEMGALKPADTVLIHNAGGGVGLAALDIAKNIGANTIGTASAGKHEFLAKRGLGIAIDYRTRDWLPQLMEATANKGVELIIDPMGSKSWKKSYKALRSTGRLGMFGVSEVTESSLFGKLRYLGLLRHLPVYTPIGLMNDNKSVFGVNMGRLWHEPEKSRDWLIALMQGVTEGWLKPHVDKVFSFEEVQNAHEYLESRRNIGKVILVP